ncbi:unnamed protein product [Sympodiomycopsis kandeliae]
MNDTTTIHYNRDFQEDMNTTSVLLGEHQSSLSPQMFNESLLASASPAPGVLALQQKDQSDQEQAINAGGSSRVGKAPPKIATDEHELNSTCDDDGVCASAFATWRAIADELNSPEYLVLSVEGHSRYLGIELGKRQKDSMPSGLFEKAVEARSVYTKRRHQLQVQLRKKNNWPKRINQMQKPRRN